MVSYFASPKPCVLGTRAEYLAQTATWLFSFLLSSFERHLLATTMPDDAILSQILAKLDSLSTAQTALAERVSTARGVQNV